MARRNDCSDGRRSASAGPRLSHSAPPTADDVEATRIDGLGAPEAVAAPTGRAQLVVVAFPRWSAIVKGDAMLKRVRQQSRGGDISPVTKTPVPPHRPCSGGTSCAQHGSCGGGSSPSRFAEPSQEWGHQVHSWLFTLSRWCDNTFPHRMAGWCCSRCSHTTWAMSAISCLPIVGPLWPRTSGRPWATPGPTSFGT